MSIWNANSNGLALGIQCVKNQRVQNLTVNGNTKFKKISISCTNNCVIWSSLNLCGYPKSLQINLRILITMFNYRYYLEDFYLRFICKYLFNFKVMKKCTRYFYDQKMRTTFELKNSFSQYSVLKTFWGNFFFNLDR